MNVKAVLLFIFIVRLCSPLFAQEPGWPREITQDRTRMTYYEPQVDEWKNFTDLDFRLAIQLTPPDAQQPAVGIGVIHARTDVDVDNRTVVISNMQVTDTRFPSADAKTAQRMDELFKKIIAAQQDITISLDRLIAVTKKSKAKTVVALKNDPPAIFVSYQPAVLLQTDGKPVLAAAGSDGAQFIVNANWPVFFDTATNGYYLFDDKQWMKAAKLDGPWSSTTQLPKDISSVPQDPQWADLKKAIPPPPTTGRSTLTVFYSSVPAEIIVFDGKPVYANIPGTRLVYAKNTDADLFMHTPTKTYYYLAAGRWFRSASLNGPWTYATDSLPSDFARIPESSPASRVLVSVPGTEEAKDAVLLAQVPTTAVINPKEAAAMVKVDYDGEPAFTPIQDTSLYYATNTADKVIRLNNAYYLCKQGIWFTSSTPNGPWTTATSVPNEIYTIPPSSPVYNVTYVTQNATPDGYVYSSYTAGYFGTFIMGAAVGAIIANGSGYYYPPYYYRPVAGYPVYRPYPATYGVGSVYNPYTGAYGVGRGVYGPAGGVTRSATYNPYTGTYARGGTAYGPYGSRSAGRAYNPYTGSYAQGASVSTAYGNRSAASAGNPVTGNAAATRQGSNAYGQWGSSVVRQGGQTTATRHVTTASGSSYAAGQSSSGGRAVAGRGPQGSGGAAVTAGGDLYAGRDGNVYRKSGSNWQKYDNGSWNSASTPSTSQARPQAQSQSRTSSAQQARASSAQTQNLNQDWQARQRGATQSQRFSSFQRSGGTSGFRGGGGFGGGGGRRR